MSNCCQIIFRKSHQVWWCLLNIEKKKKKAVKIYPFDLNRIILDYIQVGLK